MNQHRTTASSPESQIWAATMTMTQVVLLASLAKMLYRLLHQMRSRSVATNNGRRCLRPLAVLYLFSVGAARPERLSNPDGWREHRPSRRLFYTHAHACTRTYTHTHTHTSPTPMEVLTITTLSVWMHGVCMCLSICQYVCRYVCICVCQYVCLYVSLSVFMCVCLPSCLSRLYVCQRQ